jgi:hypothetical protein
MNELDTNFGSLRQRMNATGIGFAGIEGVWWLPAAEPFVLPAQIAQDLTEIGQALFIFFDVVAAMYGTPAGQTGRLDQLLNYKIPAHIPRLMSQGRVESLRPDFQLQPIPDQGGAGQPAYQLVATELEICPSAHGFAHSMQVGYGLRPDLVESFADYLDGRELLFVGSSQWSEFLFEQLAFCRALAEVGAQGRVLYDLPMSAIAQRIRQGQCWRPPMFGVKEKPAIWNDDLLARIRAGGFEPFLFPNEGVWPETVGQAVVFRFGYFDCFGPDRLRYFLHWQDRGATLLNPAMFILDSKVVMAALNLPTIRAQIAARNATTLAILDRCIPETKLLHENILAELLANKDDWVIKYAGFDQHNQAWGGRSLQVGFSHSQASWAHVLQRYLALPWPAVAQRIVPSARVDMAYIAPNNQQHLIHKGSTRLRAFLLRSRRAIQRWRVRDGWHATPGHLDEAIACGSHLTVSNNASQVSEATDAIQAPVVFRDQGTL